MTAQQEKALLQAELQELRKRNDAVEKVVRERLASAVTSWREGYAANAVAFFFLRLCRWM